MILSRNMAKVIDSCDCFQSTSRDLIYAPFRSIDRLWEAEFITGFTILGPPEYERML